MSAAVEAPPSVEMTQDEDFVSLFESEYERLVRALYVLTGKGAEAEDIAQEALTRVYERWSRVRGMDSPLGYLYRVALNLHRRRHRGPLVLGLNHLGETAEGTDVDIDTRSDVARAIAALSPRLRESLFLSEWLGLSAEHIARLIRVQPSSVRARLHRARQVIKDKLGDDYA